MANWIVKTMELDLPFGSRPDAIGTRRLHAVLSGPVFVQIIQQKGKTTT